MVLVVVCLMCYVEDCRCEDAALRDASFEVALHWCVFSQCCVCFSTFDLVSYAFDNGAWDVCVCVEAFL